MSGFAVRSGPVPGRLCPSPYKAFAGFFLLQFFTGPLDTEIVFDTPDGVFTQNIPNFGLLHTFGAPSTS